MWQKPALKQKTPRRWGPADRMMNEAEMSKWMEELRKINKGSI
jgi:hypothetical protein